MKTVTVPQADFAKKALEFLNSEFDGEILVLSLCQCITSEYTDKTNPMFVLPISAIGKEEKKFIMEWAEHFGSIHYFLPKMVESFHYQVVSLKKFQESQEPFLVEARKRMKENE